MKTVDSEGVLGSSPGGSFSDTGIAYLMGLAREAQKRETGSIESGGRSQVDLGGLVGGGGRIGDFLLFI